MAGKAVFTADGSQFRAEAQKTAASAANIATEAEKARKRIVESYKMQVEAAHQVGASQKELEAITSRTASMLTKVTDDSASRYIKRLDQMEDSTRRFNAERKKLSEQVHVPTAEHKHYETPATTKSSVAIQAIGGNASVSAAEAFTAQNKFLSKAFDIAFPILGAVTFAIEIGKGVSELIAMKKEADELPSHISAAFQAITAPIETAADALRVANDQLEITIAKLEHKPISNTKLALDEARVAADGLATAALQAYQAVQKLLLENKVGILNNLFGTGDAGVVSDKIEQTFKRLSELQREQKNAVRNGQSTSGIDAEIAQARTSFRGFIDAQIKERTGSALVADQGARGGVTGYRSVAYDKVHGSQKENLNLLRGSQDILNAQDDLAEQQQANAKLASRQKQLDIDKDFSQQSLAARQKYAEETKRGSDDELSAFRASSDVTLTQERQFWYDRLNNSQQGSELYAYAQRKSNDLLKQVNDERRKQAEDLRKINDQWKAAELKGIQDALNPGAAAAARGIQDSQTTGIALRDAQRAASYAGKESDVNAQSGRITKLDAAMQLQKLHAQQYSDVLAELRENLNAVTGDTNADQAQRNRFSQQITDVEARRRQQSASDSAAVNPQGTSAGVGARDALDEFVLSTRDAASSMRSITQSILGGLNHSLAALISGGGTNFASTLQGIGQSVAEAGISNVEGSVLGALGFGKADGSRSNPFNVVVVGGNGVDQVLGGLGDPGIGGKAGGILSSLSGFFSGRAVGGNVDASGTYLVGERGPELLTMGSKSGRVTPNGQIGGTTHNYTVDARGATDPAATEAAVRRGIALAAPGIIASSVSAVSERGRRLPSTARR